MKSVLLPFLLSFYLQQYIGFVGIYQNYFIVDIRDNNSLLLIPKDNFNKTRMIPDQNIVNNNPGFNIDPFFSNVDNNGLIWVYANINSKDYFLGLSLNDIINNGKSNVKEIFNVFDRYAMYPNSLTNGSFHNIVIGGFGYLTTYTFPVIANGMLTVVLSGYLLFFSEGIIILDQLRNRKR